MSPEEQPPDNDQNFGENYAILNLDFMSILIDGVQNSPEGQSFTSNCIRWNNAVHMKDPRPLTIFTTLEFSNRTQPQLAKPSPFSKLIEGFGTFEKGSSAVQISPYFVVDEMDIVLQKTRWYAGAGNSLEQILRSRHINSVILSGLSHSAVVMSTVYHLFDLDYTIYIILDIVMEFPGGQNEEELKAFLRRLPVITITLDEAIKMLERSK